MLHSLMLPIHWESNQMLQPVCLSVCLSAIASSIVFVTKPNTAFEWVA